jgi:hypothetical protein
MHDPPVQAGPYYHPDLVRKKSMGRFSGHVKVYNSLVIGISRDLARPKCFQVRRSCTVYNFEVYYVFTTRFNTAEVIFLYTPQARSCLLLAGQPLLYLNGLKYTMDCIYRSRLLSSSHRTPRESRQTRLGLIIFKHVGGAGTAPRR